MGQRDRLRVVAGRAAGALPMPLRGRLARTAQRMRRGASDPLVTVVITVSDDVTTKIDPALESVRAQGHHNLEILIAPFAGAGAVSAAAEIHAAKDWRVRVLPAQSSSAEARNRAAARARGDFLVFVSGADSLPLRAVALLLATAAVSGSPVVVGQMSDPPRRATPRAHLPYDTAHRERRLSVDLSAAPVALTDLHLGNKLFATRWWHDEGFQFTPRIPSGSDVVLAAYRHAPAFDLIPEITYIADDRRDGLAVGAVAGHLDGLADWLEDQSALWAVVEGLASSEARTWWLWGSLDMEFQLHLDDVERASDDQWQRMRDYAQRVHGHAADETWTRLRAESRVKLWLLLQDRRRELEEFVAARWFEYGERPTRVQDGVVRAELPFHDDPAIGVPKSHFVMTEDETPLRVTLAAVRWVTEAELELQLRCRIDHVSFVEPPRVVVRLRATDGREVDLSAVSRSDLEANLFEGHAYQDYSPGGVTVRIDVGALAPQSGSAGQVWRLLVELETSDGLSRKGMVTHLDSRGSAGLLNTRHLPVREVGGRRTEVSFRPADGLTIAFAPGDEIRLVTATASRDDLDLVVNPGPHQVTGLRVNLPAGRSLEAIRVGSGQSGECFRFSAVAKWLEAGPQNVVAVTGAGEELPVGWPNDAPAWLATGSGDAVAGVNGHGRCVVQSARAVLAVTALRHVPGEVRLEGYWLGVPATKAILRLRSEAHEVLAECEPGDEPGTVRARFSTRRAPWGLAERAIPTGRYLLDLLDPAQGRVVLAAELVVGLLETELDDEFRWRVVRSGQRPGIFLQAPINPGELGSYQQRRLRGMAASLDLPIDEGAVYLQSYSGASATDSQAAIYGELRRRRPDLTVYWGVADSSSIVPEGVRRVVINSAEWFRVLGTVKYLCLNVDVGRWFRKRPGQLLLQTFHGYPAKSMGIRMWRAKGLTPRRIEMELERTSGTWDLILTPAPEMDEHYRREYRYEGAIHSAGYPRTDALVGDGVGEMRTRTRQALGLTDDQIAVLYAPTWRDDLADNWRSAKLVAHLDLEAASGALGPRYVLMMRGHRFHQTQGTSGGAGILDVSDYPEINDLIAAADVAVLDYSSLRFDFALTDRPMLFLVPDLDQYSGDVRGFLFDYRESAPGPLVQSAAEVVERLRDLDGLRAECGPQIAAFNERFNYLMDGQSASRVVQAFFHDEAGDRLGSGAWTSCS